MINLSNRHINLSHINNLEDLDAEIMIVRRRIKIQEREIKETFSQLPQEAVKSALGSIAPMFKKAKTADMAFTAIQTLVGGIVASVIAGKENGGGFKKGLAETLRQLSFWGTAKAVINLFGSKKK